MSRTELIWLLINGRLDSLGPHCGPFSYLSIKEKSATRSPRKPSSRPYRKIQFNTIAFYDLELFGPQMGASGSGVHPHFVPPSGKILSFCRPSDIAQTAVTHVGSAATTSACFGHLCACNPIKENVHFRHFDCGMARPCGALIHVRRTSAAVGS